MPFPPARDFPNPGIKPTSPALAGGFFTTEPPGKLILLQILKLKKKKKSFERRDPLRIVFVSYEDTFMRPS